MHQLFLVRRVVLCAWQFVQAKGSLKQHYQKFLKHEYGLPKEAIQVLFQSVTCRSAARKQGALTKLQRFIPETWVRATRLAEAACVLKHGADRTVDMEWVRAASIRFYWNRRMAVSVGEWVGHRGWGLQPVPHTHSRAPLLMLGVMWDQAVAAAAAHFGQSTTAPAFGFLPRAKTARAVTLPCPFVKHFMNALSRTPACTAPTELLTAVRAELRLGHDEDVSKHVSKHTQWYLYASVVQGFLRTEGRISGGPASSDHGWHTAVMLTPAAIEQLVRLPKGSISAVFRGPHSQVRV